MNNEERVCLCKVCKPFKDQPEIKYVNKQAEIERLEKELKKKDQIIEKAEKALNNYAIADDVGAIARQYFKDKDKE